MIRNPDSVVCNFERKEVIKPDWYKVFLFVGTDSKITKHECLYELKFKKVEKLPADKKRIVKEFLDAFLFKDSVQKQLVL